jgi:tRNA threonylcarbamoyladenosine biosynthesis protein TsaE
MLFHLPTEDESIKFATTLAKFIKPPLVITFSGEIGMGKTTLIRSLLRSLGVSSAIKSPTFSLLESYDLGRMQLHHFDLYRIQDETELDYIGFRDYFGVSDVCCVEWPNRAEKYLADVDLAFKLVRKGEGRDMQVDALTPAGNTLLAGLAGSYE